MRYRVEGYWKNEGWVSYPTEYGCLVSATIFLLKMTTYYPEPHRVMEIP